MLSTWHRQHDTHARGRLGVLHTYVMYSQPYIMMTHVHVGAYLRIHINTSTIIATAHRTMTYAVARAWLTYVMQS